MPEKMDLPRKIRALRQFIRSEGRAPSYREMLALFGYRSKNAVHGLVRKLERMGYLRKSRGRLAPTAQLTGALKLLGAVQAGFPSPAEEELADTLSLDDFLVERPDATYILTVSGDSMIEAGIHPGDLVLVEKGRAPRERDIVVAQVDDEWTLKYFSRDADGILLLPANRAYAAIRPRRSLVIGGVVRAVIRKY